MPRPLKPLNPYASWPALFGAAVQQLRLQLRAKPLVSQRELGQRLGFDGSTVGAVERAVLRPDAQFVECCERELPAGGMLLAMLPLVDAAWDEWSRLGVRPRELVPSAPCGESLRLVTSHADLLDEMAKVVKGADEFLAVTGSRSRDTGYLSEIERVLEDRPEVVHYRLLFGPPHHEAFRSHLLRLITLRDPTDRSSGVKRLYIGIIDDPHDEPERFICASERRAVLAIPSVVTAGNFDSGVVFSKPQIARAFVQHVKEVYPSTRRLETKQALRDLGVSQ